jgi:hypothetical protein
VTRRASLAAAAASSLIAIALAVSGGFMISVGGVRVSARSPRAAVALSLVLAAAWLYSSTRARSTFSDLAWLSSRIERHSRAWLLVLTLTTGVLAAALGTRSPSGADASGYLSQAAMWARLDWRVSDTLSATDDWPLRADQTAPLGWRPAPDVGWQVPTYAPGLPLLMAVPFALAGNTGASAVVAVSAAVAVFATGALARTLTGGTAALLGAALLGSSPTFLYQSLQPMSDVPVTAAWLVAFWMMAERRHGLSGVATAVAVLVRPNLAPLAALPLAWAVWSSPAPRRFPLAVRFSWPVAAAAAVVAGLQWQWYGSPVVSGYGTAGELFTVSNVVPNARLYASWLWEAEPAFVLVGATAVLGALVLRLAAWRGVVPRQARPTRSRVPMATLVVFSSGVVAAYLVYGVFERWSYVRFLLPAMAATAVLWSALADRALGRAAPRARGLMVAVAVVTIVAGSVTVARRLEVFQIAPITARAVDAGDQLRLILPANAVLIAGEQSGSMRHETGHPIVRWDTLDVTTLRQVLDVFRVLGLEPWWVLDQWEESVVRGRFPDLREAALDWPPRVEGGPLMRTRAWRVADAPPGAITER